MADISAAGISTNAQAFLTRLENKETLVGIIGLGYVGLPLAQAFTTGGYKVLGFDIDPAKIEKLSRGESYIGHIDTATIQQMTRQG
ncbi:MAG TPA: NAD(P)-binding domain-containing protein, partial [Gemmatales bacterium]|nr:NAD(P)-binding domain-containing protein [Gemmatales bacterium]